MSALQFGYMLFAITSLWMDLSTRKIPNRLVLTGIAAACLMHLSNGGGAASMALVLSGMAAGVAASVPLYAVKAVRGGDVKWFAAAGSFAGPYEVMLLAVISVLLTGLSALCAICFSKRMRNRWLEVLSGMYIRSGRKKWLMPQGTGTSFPFLLCAVPAAALLQFLF